MRKMFFISFCFLLMNTACGNEGSTTVANSADTRETAVTDSINEAAFWKIIDQSRSAAGNSYPRQITALASILGGFSAEQISGFDDRFKDMLAVSYDGSLWAAATVINGGCSDDCFDYFREYLIAQGKVRFYATLKDPDASVSWIASESQVNWEGLRGVAASVYKKKTGKSLPDSYQPAMKLKGRVPDEDAAIMKYPKLAKKFLGF
ncbi:MAG: DUF4240 domain-containing protein [Pedobacter sp.]|nr:MAG: DUF4240 domain-containing protein [Pedobacter sp.]